VRPPGSPEIRTLVRLAVAVVVIAALYVAQDVLIPIVLATMLSFVLSPLVDLFQRGRLSRVPSVIITVLLAFCVIAAAGLLMARQASALASDAPQYAAAIEQKVQNLQTYALTRLSGILRPSGRGEAVPSRTGAATGGAAGPAGARESTLDRTAGAAGKPAPQRQRGVSPVRSWRRPSVHWKRRSSSSSLPCSSSSSARICATASSGLPARRICSGRRWP
jgi:hypothetical protein